MGVYIQGKKTYNKWGLKISNIKVILFSAYTIAVEIGGDIGSDIIEIETPLVSTNFATRTQWTIESPQKCAKRLSNC